MTERREVRVADSFFVELDDQLNPERGPAGEPSATDFLVTDLPAIVEQFAIAFDDLTEAIEGLPAIRMYIGTGALVRAFVVHAVETHDGVVQLVGIVSDAMLTTLAIVRFECRSAGHPLEAPLHANDLWVAASAVHLNMALVTANKVFADVPGLTLA